MIPQIKEINFPEYATLSTATASLVDMGDKTITTQVKIDGSIVPDFSYDWEIEFQGERYIQPLREPQANKGNESINSIIDLTFYHKGIYDLKRYFFVSVPTEESGVVMADDYIVPLQLNLKEFVVYLNKVFEVYQSQYKGAYKVFLNPDIKVEDTDKKTIDINYTKIWDVITKIYEWFDVRWYVEESDQGNDIRSYAIKIGYPSTEVSHVFEYGFNGGLLKFERQVQDQEIANMVFGRGSSDNIPYRYFKNKSEDNPTFPADPDWIPELENVYFANLRGKTFRDYVKGWKAKHYGGETMANPTDEYTRGYNDETFNPIEYVSDIESIAKYGEIQKGLEHNEEIKPTIQGVTIGDIGRVGEIVDVEPILVDEDTENTEWESKVINIDEDKAYSESSDIATKTYTIKTSIYQVPYDYKGSFIKDYEINAIEKVEATLFEYSGGSGDPIVEDLSNKEWKLYVEIQSFKLVNADTNTEIGEIVNINGGTNMYVEYTVKVTGFVEAYDNTIDDPWAGTIGNKMDIGNNCEVIISLSWQLDYTPVHGQILGNYENGVTRKSQTETIPANGISQVVFTTEQFTITEENAPATSVEMPYRITSSLKGGEYDPRPNVVAINVDTNEQMTSLNLPAGTYYLQNSIQITNLANEKQTFKVELLPTYIYYSYDSASWKPTFDIWVKNIWQTKRQYITPSPSIPIKPHWESDDEYASRVWDAILGNHLGDDAKVVFSSGWLSGHSNWEFTIARRPVFDDSKIIDGVPSEWRITLYKSDAEIEATNKWLPSIATHANAGDHFLFVGIEFPHQYVLWAEEKLDEYKREELGKVSDVKSTIVVQLDKVRVNQMQEAEIRPLVDSLRIGNSVRVTDFRFIKGKYEECYDVDGKRLYDVNDEALFVLDSNEVLCLQSVTYTWDASTIMLPNIEVVLSNKIIKRSNPYSDTKIALNEIKSNISDTKVEIDKFKQVAKKSETTAKVASTQASTSLREVNSLSFIKHAISEKEVFGEKVVVSKGVFEGITKSQLISITKNNISEILPTKATTIEGYQRYSLSPLLMSAIMNISNDEISIGGGQFIASDSITFVMPVLYNYTLYDEDGVFTKDELRGMVGLKFIIYNDTPALVHFCGKRYDPIDHLFSDVDICYDDWIVNKGQFAIVECKLELDLDNREVIYWDIKVGRHRRIDIS